MTSLLQEAVEQAKKEQQGAAADLHDGADEDPEERAQQRQVLEEELERRVKDAFLFYEQRFAQLPSVSRLRELWKERRIEDTDPIWLMTDVLALYDARGQIALQQIVRILRACQELNQHTISEMRDALEQASRLQLVVAEMNPKIDGVLARMTDFGTLMGRFEKQVPTLLNTMYRATSILDTRSKRAVWELVGIVAGAVAVGAVLGVMLAKILI
jgi:hypothetical protein